MLYTFVNGQKKKINTLYTFVNGQKKYIIKPIDYVTLTVNPTYSPVKVTFNTSGEISGKSITVPKGTTVSYTLSADNCITRPLFETVNETKTVTPQILLSKISPIINYNAGTSYQISSWVNRGQCITAGNYTYTRGGKSNTWVVGVDSNGSITSYSTSGDVTSTSGGSNLTLSPTGGWNFQNIWK